jgi:hypothetical protein
MKRLLFIIMSLIIIISLSADPAEISRSDLSQLAARNAAAEWGNVFPMEPVPYYGADDDIIAYCFPFSIDQPPLATVQLIERSDLAWKNGNRDLAQGNLEYAHLVIGAKRSISVFLMYGQLLPGHLSHGVELREKAQELFPEGYSFHRIYYFSPAAIWYSYTDGKTVKYLSPLPKMQVLEEEQFSELKSAMPRFWERGDPARQWEAFLDNRHVLNRHDYTYIPGLEKMPLLQGMYSSETSAAAMLFCWWNNHRGYGNLNNRYSSRYDHDYEFMNHHVPTVASDFAYYSDTEDGNTTFGNVEYGLINTVTQSGYTVAHYDEIYGIYNSSVFWWRARDEALNGRPSIVHMASSWGLFNTSYHAVTIVGYYSELNSDIMLGVAYSSGNSVPIVFDVYNFESHYRINLSDSPIVSTELQVTSPRGESNVWLPHPREILYSGNIHEITWFTNKPEEGYHVKIYYHVYGADGSEPYQWVVDNYPNTGRYIWNVPDILDPWGSPDTTWGRIYIKLVDSATNEVIAEDGSFGNFSILSGGPQYGNLPSNVHSIIRSPDFYRAELNAPGWKVIGIRDDLTDNSEPNQYDRWTIDLYDNDQYGSVVRQSVATTKTNYLLINNYELPAHDYGIKFTSNGGSQAYANLDGNSNNQIQVNQAYNKNWPNNKAAEVYNVYLEPGSYAFSFGNTPLDFGLYKADGSGLYSYHNAVAGNRTGLSAFKRFNYIVTSLNAGWYALVVSSQHTGAFTYSINITDEMTWTGAVSNNWFNPQNWSQGFVPSASNDVIIPANAHSSPLILNPSQAAAIRNITIEHGKSLTIGQGANLTVEEDMTVDGLLLLNHSTSRLTVHESLYFGMTGVLNVSSAGEITCRGDLIIGSGAVSSLSSSSLLKLGYISDSFIYNDSPDFTFHNLTINTNFGASVTVSTLSQADLVVSGHLKIDNNTIFRSESVRAVKVQATMQHLGNLEFINGTLAFSGAINVMPIRGGDIFHNVEIDVDSFFDLNSSLQLTGDLIINGGTLRPGAYNIHLKGDWINNVRPGGFIKGTSNVVFSGDGEQICSGEDFYRFTINNPLAEVHFPSGESSCDFFDMQSGALHITGGNLVVQDMIRNGIVGKTVVDQGELHLNQDSAQRTDLNGELVIRDGLMTVSGGAATSQWSNAADASIEMSGGVLDFKTSNIQIVNSTYSFTEDITAGIIRTVGNFICQRNNFRPEMGYIELYGPGTGFVSFHPQSYLQGIIVNKTSTREDETSISREETNDRTNRVILISPLHLRGSLILGAGDLDLNDNALTIDGGMDVYGNLLMNNPSDNLLVDRSLTFFEGSSSQITQGMIELGNWLIIEEDAGFQMAADTTLRFFGLGMTAGGFNYANIDNNATGTTFGNLIVDKPDLANLYVYSPAALSVLGYFNIQNESNVELNDCDLTVSGNFTLNNESKLTLLDYSSLKINGTVTIEDELIVASYSELICMGTFALPAEGSLMIYDESLVKLTRAYTGTYFSFTGNVVLNEDAILEITHNGLQIGTTGNLQLNSGTIRIGWAFRANNPNTFNGDTGTVEFIGARAGQIEMHSTNSFYDLVINKPGIGFSVLQATQALASRDIIIQDGNLMPMSNILRAMRDLKLEGGRLSLAAGSVVQVARNWINTAGTSAFDEGTGTVQFIDNGNLNSIIPTETFHNLTINKGVGCYAEVPGGETLTVKGSLNIAFRRLTMNPGSTLKLNNNAGMLIGAQGELYAVGTAAQPITIGADSGYYSFQTYSGSRISARYTVFERMNANGINLALGSIVDTDHPFNYCTFREGAVGGTLLKKYSTQGFMMEEPVFPANTWNGAYNVYHEPGEGHLIIRSATGGFSGAAYENDPDSNIIWTFYSTNPYVAHSPQPANNSEGIEPSANLGWTYTSHPSFAEPIGYIVKMGTDPVMALYEESYVSGGAGTYTIAPLVSLSLGNTYYWQVIPTTDPESRGRQSSLERDNSSRGPAVNCPIWNFTVSETIISSFPYFQDFEAGPGSWYGGSISRSNIWEWGVPDQDPMDNAYSGTKVWATGLTVNYPNDADSWLSSPIFDFSTVTAPSLSVWLHLNIESGYDGMIMESSDDGGNTWEHLNDPGFYNSTITYGAHPQPNWSGLIGEWTQFTTTLPHLANQSNVQLRFRFITDNSVTYQGAAVDDIEIWDADFVPTFNWEENFDGVASGGIPAGWERSTTNWGASTTTHAGGSSPEMRFYYLPENSGEIYLKTLPLDTSGFSNLDLSFRHMLDHYSGLYTLKLVTILGETEYLLREWVSPGANIPAEIVTHSITSAQGAGESNLQIAWIFSGNSDSINHWCIDDIVLESPTPGPTTPHSPAPFDGASEVPLPTILSWGYNSQTGYPDPVGYRLRIGTSPTMTSYTERYISGGPGYYHYDSDIILQYATTYFWQVIPTTDEESRQTSGIIRSSDLWLPGSDSDRSNALDCPIWTFTTEPLPPVANYPYFESFEDGTAGWTSGAFSGNDHWQLGWPSQSRIDMPLSGTNAWMTYLDQNYENEADTWLKSPVFDFSELDDPNLSVWLNIWSEASYDGMILEYSLDNSSWQQVIGDDGFYNRMSLPAPSHPNWSGRTEEVDGIWTEYSTSLPFLANEPQVWFCFRFTSDGDYGEAYVDEGIAIDDFRIWNTIAPPATAHSPQPEDGAIDVPMETFLEWTYTSQEGYTDPVVYQIRAGTDPTLATYQSDVLWGGPGTHSMPPFFTLEYGQTYYWQVIPSASGEEHTRSLLRDENPELSHPLQYNVLRENASIRSSAENCPIWSFTLLADATAIEIFPYFEDFELSDGGWKGGRISGMNIWQQGEPSQTVINSAYSGDYAWMTNLGGNYMNGADIWLRSPLFDFTALDEPMFSVRINHQTEPDYDGMILEATIDGGSNWFYVEADTGFYNNTSLLGPLNVPKWSGNSGGWTEFSTSLSSLAHQPQVRLRFRFASNESVTEEGFAIDDIRIWEREYSILTLNPSSHDFGRVEVDESSPVQYFEITNTGEGLLYLSPDDISLAGWHPAEFELINLSSPVELSSGQSTTIGAKFRPNETGQKEAVINIVEGSAPGRELFIKNHSRSFEREIHSIGITGFGYQLVTENVPYYEGFSIEDEGSLPAGWESSHLNWWVSGTSQAGSESPEMLFSFDPHIIGEVTLLSPLFDTSGLSQIDLTFKQQVDHLDGVFDLRIYSIVDTDSYLIQEWLNVDSSLAAQELDYLLTTAEHGVGADNLRLAWVFDGNSYNITGWHLDGIILGGDSPAVITNAATEVNYFEAVLNAQITSTGDLPILEKGFYYDTDPDPANSGLLVNSSSPGESFSALAENLEQGSDIYYIAFADNPRGRAWSEVMSFTTLSLPVPQNLAATARDGAVDLSWDDINPPVRPDGNDINLNSDKDYFQQRSSRISFLGYNVYRNSEQINEEPVEGTEYTDNNVVNGVTYEYYVTAVYEEGESGHSNTVEATPQVSGALQSPQNVTISVAGSTVYLSWDAVEGANSYKIYARSEPVTNETDPLNGWQLLMQQDSSLTTYSEAASNRRYYRVVASPLPVTR